MNFLMGRISRKHWIAILVVLLLGSFLLFKTLGNRQNNKQSNVKNEKVKKFAGISKKDLLEKIEAEKSGNDGEQQPDDKPANGTNSNDVADQTPASSESSENKSNDTDKKTGATNSVQGGGATGSTGSTGSTGNNNNNSGGNQSGTDEEDDFLDPVEEVEKDKELTIGGVSWKVVDVQKTEKLSNGNSSEAAAGIFVIVGLEAKLVREKSVMVDTEWIFLADSTDTYYNNDIGAEGILQDQNKETLAYDELVRNRVLKGYLIFDIPKETSNSLKLLIFDMDLQTYDYGIIKL